MPSGSRIAEATDHTTDMTLLKTLAVANYRSIHSLVVPLGALTLVTGPNGATAR
jgi:hypothetical protein